MSLLRTFKSGPWANNWRPYIRKSLRRLLPDLSPAERADAVQRAILILASAPDNLPVPYQFHYAKLVVKWTASRICIELARLSRYLANGQPDVALLFAKTIDPDDLLAFANLRNCLDPIDFDEHMTYAIIGATDFAAEYNLGAETVRARFERNRPALRRAAETGRKPCRLCRLSAPTGTRGRKRKPAVT